MLLVTNAGEKPEPFAHFDEIVAGIVFEICALSS